MNDGEIDAAEIDKELIAERLREDAVRIVFECTFIYHCDSLKSPEKPFIKLPTYTPY